MDNHLNLALQRFLEAWATVNAEAPDAGTDAKLAAAVQLVLISLNLDQKEEWKAVERLRAEEEQKAVERQRAEEAAKQRLAELLKGPPAAGPPADVPNLTAQDKLDGVKESRLKQAYERYVQRYIERYPGAKDWLGFNDWRADRGRKETE